MKKLDIGFGVPGLLSATTVAILTLAGCSSEPLPPGPITPPGPFCGGIAGIPCPGSGECVDDPSDSCDPEMGGADCGGVCRCPAIEECALGEVFDGTADVCACVTPVTTCAAVTCVVGSVCVEYPDGTAGCVSRDPCLNTECPEGMHCSAPADKPECVPDDADIGEVCGSVICGEGTQCCNASCSMCAPPDSSCIQIACESELE